MTKIMMHGCNGVMGQVITKIVEETDDAVMAAGVDRRDEHMQNILADEQLQKLCQYSFRGNIF